MADFDAPHYRTSPLQAKSSTRRTAGGSNFFCSNFLLRLLFIALFLSVLSQFTSQPPDFISDTVFAKSWELVHLFIIGIIVSYGLFGRRGTQSHMEIQAPLAFNSPNNLHPSTVFNFDHQNPCAYGFHGNANVNEAREYRPFGLEPTVVVRPGTHDLDYKPLDLPVRSLRSRVDEESDGEMCASESEIEAGESSSCCCYEEDNESENLEEDNVANTCSPTPWNWPNVVNPNVKQTGYEMFGPPESESESRSMDVGVDNVLASQSVYFGAGLHEVKHVKNLPESPASVEENSRKNVELGSSVEEKTASSLESRSIRVAFKEKVGDVSVQAGTKCQDPRKASSPEYSPWCSDASVEAECLERKSRMQKLQSPSSPKSESVSPSWDFLPPSLPESSLPLSALSEPLPTTEMDSLQREGKNGENSPEQMREASSIDNANGFPLKRVRSRGRRSRKGDEMNSRTSSLRSESSCETTFSPSPSPSSSSQNFTSTTQPKPSPGTGKFKQVEISALEIDPVLPTESSSIQLMGDLDKDDTGKSRTLSRTPNSRRFSIGSIFDRELWKGSKVATKETRKKEKDENCGDTSGKCGWDCLKLDMKSTPTKNSLRGKSVRTVRPQAITLEPSCKNEKKTDERTRERQDLVIISIGISGKNNTYAMNQKCTSTNAKQERAESCSLEPGEDKERFSCVQDVNEDEDCNSEIDRKAGEFIAKFKEQIRLQKGTSRRVSGKN